MENHRDDTVVIFAGYGPDMQRFVKTNPGLKSRIPTTIHFPAYNGPDMVKIMHGMVKQGGNKFSPSAKRHVELAIHTIGEGNAREVRNLYDEISDAQSRRLVATHGGGDIPRADLEHISSEDVAAGAARYARHRPNIDVKPKGKRPGKLVAV